MVLLSMSNHIHILFHFPFVTILFLSIISKIHLKESLQEIAANFEKKIEQHKFNSFEEEKILISSDQDISCSNIIPFFSKENISFSDNKITFNKVFIELLFDITITHKMKHKLSSFQISQSGMICTIYYEHLILSENEDNSYTLTLPNNPLNNITFTFGELETFRKYSNLYNNITYMNQLFLSKTQLHINKVLAIYPESISYTYFLEFLQRLREPKVYTFDTKELSELKSLKIESIAYNENIDKQNFNTIVYKFRVHLNYTITAVYQATYTFERCDFGKNIICNYFYPRNDLIENALIYLYENIYKHIVN